jgi:energy-coupling factor transport system ATP-binding protein
MIELKGLSFKYAGGEKLALSGVEMVIPDGDFVGVIGPSGAGKTTLTHVISGAVPHHFRGDFYGAAIVDGTDTVESSPEKLSRKVGSVFQDVEAQLVASTVEEEVLFGLLNYGLKGAAVEKRLSDALERIGISALRERRIESLSGGQKQKVAIAATLALSPRILVLDEPTGELDPQSSREIFETLKELNEREDVTVVAVEQKIGLLSAYAKRLAVLDGGKLVRFAPVREALEGPEELTKIGVHVPRIVSLAGELHRRGLYEGGAPVDIREAAEMVAVARGR